MVFNGAGILDKLINNGHGEKFNKNHFIWIKSLPYPVAVCDNQGRILTMNDPFVKLTGLPEDDLELQRIYWFLPKAGGEEIKNELKHLRQNSSIIREMNIESFGEEKDMEVTVIPFEQPEEVTAQFWIFSDQSEKKRMEAELKQLKKRSIVQEEPFKIGTWTYNFEQQEFYASQDTYQIFGRSPEEFDGSLDNVLEFLHREDQSRFQTTMKKAHLGEPLDLIFRIVTGEGEEKDIHARGEMFYRKDQSPDKMIGTVQDLTSRRYVEKRLENLHKILPKEETLNKRKCYRVDLTREKIELGEDIRETYGFDPEVKEHCREELLERIHPEDRVKISNIIANLKENETYEIQYRVVGPEKDSYRLVRSKGTGEFQNEKLIALVGAIEDLTDMYVLRKDIEKTYRELQEAQQTFRMGMWSMDLRSFRLSWSKVTFEIYGVNPEQKEPDFEEFLQMIHPGDRKIVHQAIKEPPNKQPFEVEFRILPPGGKERHVKHLVEILYQDDTPILIRGNIQDVTDQKYLEKKTRKTKRDFESIQNRYQMLLDNSDEILEIIDEKGLVKYINPGVVKMTGFTHKEIEGKYIWGFVEGAEKDKLKSLIDMSQKNPKKIIKGTIRSATKQGREMYLEVTINNHLNNPEIRGIILNWKDTTAKVNLQKKIDRIANYDDVTDLPNRSYFRYMISEELQRARKIEEGLALFMIDIDEFKQINNALGSDVGDQLIRNIGQKIQRKFSWDRGFLARYYGDQFALLVRDVKDSREGGKIAGEILDLFEPQFFIGEYALNVNISMGFSTYPDDGRHEEELIKNSSSALARAKEDGKNGYEAYSSKFDVLSFKNFSLRNDLSQAIEKDQLRLHFQPIINLHNGKIVAIEALIRWEHPEWGMVSPNEFIPIAESSGFIVPMGRWVLEQVCSHYREWMDKGYPAIKVSVNCSGIEFFQRNFVSDIRSTLEKHKLDPKFLILEITESVVIEQRQQTKQDIAALQDMGIQIAIDDFGTGYSSLTYLNKMDVDILKIDQEFLKLVPKRETSNKILEAVVNLAKELKIRIVAEGIENWDQLIFLRRLNCISGQGYLYSKPLPVKALEPLLKRGWVRPAKANNATYKVKNDRRMYFRVDFHHHLEADMTILEINGKRIKVGNTKSLIKNMGPGGLCFVANINLPIKKDLILQFNSELVSSPIRVYGTPVWKEEIDQGLVKYGLKFTFDENSRMELTGLLNKVQIRMRNDYGFNEGRFTTKSMKAYFHQQQSNNLEEELERKEDS